MKLIVAVVVAALLVAGCSGSEEPPTVSIVTSTMTVTPSPSPSVDVTVEPTDQRTTKAEWVTEAMEDIWASMSLQRQAEGCDLYLSSPGLTVNFFVKQVDKVSSKYLGTNTEQVRDGVGVFFQTNC